MLMENRLDQLDYDNLVENNLDTSSYPLVWHCSECDSWVSFFNPDDHIVTCDHNPSDEHWMCPTCHSLTSLISSHIDVVDDDGYGYKLMSDGDQIYLETEEGELMLYGNVRKNTEI